MSKARTLADFISDGSEFADGTISVAEVSGAAPLASPTFTGTASGTFSGPLTGNVTGNVTGDLTGDVTGNVTGNLTGNVTGDVAGDIDLSAIAATIADTAVDIFVYDTRKDSDGGAWRKRTQHTSWYNETLNTATRGSRREFPAVAVIVAESTQVTIYDGDDPDLPMWMVFNQNTPNMIRNSLIKSIHALNGNLCVGAHQNQSIVTLNVINFVKDNSLESSYANGYSYNGNIEQRNDGLDTTATTLIGSIVNSYVNDVAMTVLPNAPIDAATGLPVPTIAVGTDGGLSVIKDDGTVVDITGQSGYNKTDQLAFLGDKLLYRQDNTSSVVAIRIDEIPSSDFVTTNTVYQTQNSLFMSYQSGGNGGSYDTMDTVIRTTGEPSILIAEHGKALSCDKGLTFFDFNETAPSNSMVSHSTSDYATGWMNGDIKLATLSDTDDTNVTGSELVTNGTFDTDTSGWTAVNSSLSASGGQLTITSTVNGAGYAYQAITVVSGKKYVATIDSVSGTGVAGKTLYAGTSAGSGNLGGVQLPGDGSTVNLTFTASGTNTVYIFVYQDGNTASGDTTVVDNISVRLAEEDRSVNGNGLQVFGTVTKSAVATGADLVAYSGFNTVNNLIQPHNDDLDFGTGDFAVFAWMQYGTATQTNIVDYAEYGSATGRFEFYLDSNKVIRVAVGSTYTSLGTASASGWSLFGVVRQNGVVKTYENGKEMGTSTNQAGSIGGSNHKLWVGTNYLGGGSGGGHKLSLLRISRTVPSPEQIKKIYEDEKVLFQEGAQATLYGSSDAVTALAYDDSTELLHVGTSAGRSVFQGLRRVDNTTTAVGAAISASNGLVADE